MTFKTYVQDIKKYSNQIQLKDASYSGRSGKAGVRDKTVFGKMSWNEALSYISIIQSVIIFTALIPDAVGTVNGFLEWLGIPYQFPVDMASVGAVIFIIIVFIFGLIAVRHVGTLRSASEVGNKMNPGMFMLYERQEEILKKLEELEK